MADCCFLRRFLRKSSIVCHRKNSWSTFTSRILWPICFDDHHLFRHDYSSSSFNVCSRPRFQCIMCVCRKTITALDVRHAPVAWKSRWKVCCQKKSKCFGNRIEIHHRKSQQRSQRTSRKRYIVVVIDMVLVCSNNSFAIPINFQNGSQLLPRREKRLASYYHYNNNSSFVVFKWVPSTSTPRPFPLWKRPGFQSVYANDSVESVWTYWQLRFLSPCVVFWFDDCCQSDGLAMEWAGTTPRTWTVLYFRF